MITTNINGTDKFIRNELSEITIREFEYICKILVTETDYVERYIRIFSIFGLSTDDITTIEAKLFLDLIKQFNMASWTNEVFVKEIVLDGRTLQSYTGSKYVLSIRDLSKIEQYIKANRENYVAEMLAVIYKEVTAPKELWYDKDHIDNKILLFRSFATADIAIPYINLIMNDIIKNIL